MKKICDMCSKSFDRSNDLQRHIKSMHKNLKRTPMPRLEMTD